LNQLSKELKDKGMKIACCIWALRPPETNRLHQISQIRYAGALSLELHPSLPRPLDALAGSRDILLQTGSSL